MSIKYFNKIFQKNKKSRPEYSGQLSDNRTSDDYEHFTKCSLHIQFPFHIFGVEELVRLVTRGLAEEFIVHLFDKGVLM